MSDQTAIIRVQPRFEEVEVLPPESDNGARMWGQAQIFAGMVAQAVVQASQAPRFSDAELDRLWAEAFEKWLERTPKTGAPRPGATREAYAAAWADLRSFNPKHPRHLDGLDIREWAEDLRTRPVAPSVARGLVRSGRREDGQMGLSPSTVNQYLSAVSSFYSYCQRYEVRAADGRVVPLFEGLNPAKSQMVTRPKARRFGQDVTWLDRDQLAALKNCIRSAGTLSDLEAGVARSPTTLVELRDYALFLTFIMTGARNREVRTWQWKDLIRQGGKTFFAWANKGKDGRKELPPPCWQAVLDYLRVAGRLDGIQPDDYVFCATVWRVDGDTAAATWRPDQPLSPQEVNRALRKYCQRAGIESATIHVHSLRHSMNMLYAALGVPVEDRSRMLNHSSLDMTDRYTHELEGQCNVHWKLAGDALGL